MPSTISVSKLAACSSMAWVDVRPASNVTVTVSVCPSSRSMTGDCRSPMMFSGDVYKRQVQMTMRYAMWERVYFLPAADASTPCFT